jgi:hypothetical protein
MRAAGRRVLGGSADPESTFVHVDTHSLAVGRAWWAGTHSRARGVAAKDAASGDVRSRPIELGRDDDQWRRQIRASRPATVRRSVRFPPAVRIMAEWCRSA